MGYLIAGLVMMLLGVAAAVYFGLKLRAVREAAAQVDDHADELAHERAIRRNLQRVCDRRGAELNRVRGELRDRDDEIERLEDEISAMKIRLFDENGRRILAEKDESGRRIKLELQDRQIAELEQKLRQAREGEKQLRAIIAERDAEIDRLRARNRRPRRPEALEPGQVTLEDILKP